MQAHEAHLEAKQQLQRSCYLPDPYSLRKIASEWGLGLVTIQKCRLPWINNGYKFENYKPQQSVSLTPLWHGHF